MLKKKILIVDDSNMAREMLKAVFEGSESIEVLEATNGQDAIKICNSSSPDLVLLDIIMQNGNGMDVLKVIGKSTKVIIVSAVGQDAIVSEAKKLGAVDYLVKPFDKEQVLKKTGAHLRG